MDKLSQDTANQRSNPTGNKFISIIIIVVVVIANTPNAANVEFPFTLLAGGGVLVENPTALGTADGKRGRLLRGRHS